MFYFRLCKAMIEINVWMHSGVSKSPGGTATAAS